MTDTDKTRTPTPAEKASAAHARSQIAQAKRSDKDAHQTDRPLDKSLYGRPDEIRSVEPPGPGIPTDRR